MSKTVSELAQELGVSKQYLNRILTKHKLGKIKGNKKVVSDSDVKSILSMLERNIGNQKSETKNLVSDIPSKSTGSMDKDENGNQKSETKTETSFRYLCEQLEIKGKEVERLHQLLDQSQQLLLNEQKKKGTAVLFIGEDLDVLLEICDRIAVVYEGRMTGIVDTASTTKEQVGVLMAGGTMEDVEKLALEQKKEVQ